MAQKKEENPDFKKEPKYTQSPSAARRKRKKPRKTARKTAAVPAKKKPKKTGAKRAGKSVGKAATRRKKSGGTLSLKTIGYATGKTVGRLTKMADGAAKAIKGAAGRALTRKRKSK